jgi:molybdopterin molybdotransferase
MSARRGFAVRIPLEEAVRTIAASVEPLPAEEVNFYESLGRVLAEDVVAGINVPQFDRAAVDGYAVIASDTFGASPARPAKLRVVGSVKVGARGSKRLRRGEAVRIDTGARMPAGADSVVMVENVVEEGGHVGVLSPVTPGKNVSKAGEDVRAGETVLRRGRVLGPADIGLLASVRHLRPRVHRRPHVGVISTGSELVAPHLSASGPHVVDANSYSIAAAVTAAGGIPHRLGIVPDEEKDLRRKIASALKYDVVIVSGGSAVGRFDLVPEVISKMGDLKFHGAAIRPGGPSGFGVIGGKPVFCLAGFPAGALIAFDLLVRPALRKLQGLPADRGYLRVRARLEEGVPSVLGRADVVRVKLMRRGKEILARPMRITGSSMLTTVADADGFVIVPESAEGLERGQEVEVEVYGSSYDWLNRG